MVDHLLTPSIYVWAVAVDTVIGRYHDTMDDHLLAPPSRVKFLVIEKHTS